MFKVHTAVPVRVADLNPAAYNPRKITPAKFEALKESIRESGFLDPLVVQKKGTRIIGGHQRLRAVKELCTEENVACPDLPCIVLDLDDKRAKKLNVKLNKIQGDFEAQLLGELLIDIYDEPSLPLPRDEFVLLGFEQDEAERFVRLVEPDRFPLPATPSNEDGTSFGKSVTLSLEFDSVSLRDKVKKLLVANSKTAKQKTGALVAQALGLTKRKGAKTKKSAA